MENRIGPYCESDHMLKSRTSMQGVTVCCRRALDITDKHLGAILWEQDFLATDEQLERVLGLLPENVQTNLRDEFSKNRSTVYRWGRIMKEVGLGANIPTC